MCERTDEWSVFCPNKLHRYIFFCFTHYNLVSIDNDHSYQRCCCSSCFSTYLMTSYSHLFVRTEPVITDPREMHTILLFSLRDLWGSLEPHSCQLSVASAEDQEGNTLMKVTCRTDSSAAVRAALTLVTPPPYLESTIYRFDVVNVDCGSKN